MRIVPIGLLLLAACDPNNADMQPAETKPAAISFDGALVQNAAAKVAHGKRLVDVLGCAGCHGKTLEGNVWVDSPEEGVLHASNLTLALPNYSDDQLRALLRKGVHPSGRNVWDMPSELFQHLSEPDIVGLIAFLRTLKPAGEPSPTPVIGPLAKEMIARGELKPAARVVKETREVGPPELGPQLALGRYITRVTCAECHGAKLEGKPNGNPDLIAVGAYSRAEFERLITEGIPTGGRKLKPLMIGVAKGRFSKLTPRERDALYAYLKARAEQPQ
jgi:mono/diheme cytochrome c family protein